MEKLQAIAKAGLAAPSGQNKQPWHFIVVSDKELVGKFGTHGAPAMIVVLKKSYSTTWVDVDCGIAVQTMALAAASLGLGSCIVDPPYLLFEGEEAGSIKETLKWPAGYEFSIVLAVGYAARSGNPHPLVASKVHYIG